MPITVTEDAGRRKIEVLIQRVSNASLLELCESLATSLVEELHTVPWGGDIKRGLTQRTSPKKTSTGGWVIGIGSSSILHRDPAPQGTISAFLEWYRKLAVSRREQGAALAREAKASRPRAIQAAKKKFRRATFEQVRIERARAAGGITRKMAQRDEELIEIFYTAEERLEGLMTAKAYKRYQLRYERFLEAEERRRKRRHG